MSFDLKLGAAMARRAGCGAGRFGVAPLVPPKNEFTHLTEGLLIAGGILIFGGPGA